MCDNVIGNGKQISKVQIGDSAALDAFGRIRVSNIFTAFSSKFEYSKLNHLWHEVDETGTAVDQAVHDPDSSSIDMPIPATLNRALIRQSRQWIAYQPGNSHRPLLTGAFSTATAGIRKRFGLFSSNDGIYFEQSESGVYYIVLRSSSTGSLVERRIPQSQWNIDTFSTSGKNPSGINETTVRDEDSALFSFENSQILDIDLEWLGVGRVRVGFNIDGNTYYANHFKNAGFSSATYMGTASLPIRYEITNLTGANTGTMKQICQTVKTEGGSDLWGYPQTASNGVTKITTVAGVPTAVLAVRPRATFYGKENRVSSLPVGFTILTAGNFVVYYQLIHYASVTSGTWTQIDTSANHASACDYAVGADITAFSGGHIHKKGYITADNKGTSLTGSDILQILPISRGYDATVDADAETYLLVVTSIGGAVDVYSTIELADIY